MNSSDKGRGESDALAKLEAENLQLKIAASKMDAENKRLKETLSRTNQYNEALSDVLSREPKETDRLHRLIYGASVSQHLYRAFRVLIGDRNYQRYSSGGWMARLKRAPWYIRLRRRRTPETCTSDARRILLDVSFTNRIDYKSGIQRVVRNIAKELDRCDHPNLSMIPVVIENGQWRYADDMARRLKFHTPPPADPSIRPNNRDTLILIDSGWAMLPEYEKMLHSVSPSGLRIVSVIYDLIPLQLPEVVDPYNALAFRNWLNLLLPYSHQFACISEAVADDLRSFLAEPQNAAFAQIPVSAFHLGASGEEMNPLPPKHLSSRVKTFAESAENTFLMVGTLEPRKGYDCCLEAFEKLIETGADASLCIVGKYGWSAENTRRKIVTHPEFGRRLFWMEGVDDAELTGLYSSSDCLIAASLAEGFGLPLVEAAQRGIPIICSDLPVFREVCGEHATYFKCNDPSDLVHVWSRWIEDKKRGTAIASSGISWLSLEQSARQLLEQIGLPVPEAVGHAGDEKPT